MTDKTKVDEKHMNEVEFLQVVAQKFIDQESRYRHQLAETTRLRVSVESRIMRLSWRD